MKSKKLHIKNEAEQIKLKRTIKIRDHPGPTIELFCCCWQFFRTFFLKKNVYKFYFIPCVLIAICIEAASAYVALSFSVPHVMWLPTIKQRDNNIVALCCLYTLLHLFL